MSLHDDKCAEMVKRIDASMKIVRPTSLSCQFANLDDVRNSMFDHLDKDAGVGSRIWDLITRWRQKHEVEQQLQADTLAQQAVQEVAQEAVVRRSLEQMAAATIPSSAKLASSNTNSGKHQTGVKHLLKAKRYSDKGDYAAKHQIMRGLIAANPAEFVVDSEQNGIVGITHVPTGFRMHLPNTAVQGMKLERTKAAEDCAPVLGLIPLEIEGKQADLRVEIAEGPWAEARGLGGRMELPDGHGMLFKRADGFWMRGVNFDLDIMFLDKSGTVLDIQTMTKLAAGEFPTIYTPGVQGASLALEMPAGWVARNGVAVGDRIVAGSLDKQAGPIANAFRGVGRAVRSVSPTAANAVKKINPVALPAPGKELPDFASRQWSHWSMPGSPRRAAAFERLNKLQRLWHQVRNIRNSTLLKVNRLKHLRTVREHQGRLRKSLQTQQPDVALQRDINRLFVSHDMSETVPIQSNMLGLPIARPITSLNISRPLQIGSDLRPRFYRAQGLEPPKEPGLGSPLVGDNPMTRTMRGLDLHKK